MNSAAATKNQLDYYSINLLPKLLLVHYSNYYQYQLLRREGAEFAPPSVIPGRIYFPRPISPKGATAVASESTSTKHKKNT